MILFTLLVFSTLAILISVIYFSKPKVVIGNTLEVEADNLFIIYITDIFKEAGFRTEWIDVHILRNERAFENGRVDVIAFEDIGFGDLLESRGIDYIRTEEWHQKYGYVLYTRDKLSIEDIQRQNLDIGFMFGFDVMESFARELTDNVHGFDSLDSAAKSLESGLIDVYLGPYATLYDAFDLEARRQGFEHYIIPFLSDEKLFLYLRPEYEVYLPRIEKAIIKVRENIDYYLNRLP